MGLAIEQAQQAEEEGEVPVGAIFVENKEVIASAGNASIQLNDPTGHAEIRVLRQAAKKKKNYRIGGSLYVTLEPCLMCMGSLIHARVETLIFGAYDQKLGAATSVFDFSSSPDQNHRIDFMGGVLEEQCQNLLKDFFKKQRKKVKRNQY